MVHGSIGRCAGPNPSMPASPSCAHHHHHQMRMANWLRTPRQLQPVRWTSDPVPLDGNGRHTPHSCSERYRVVVLSLMIRRRGRSDRQISVSLRLARSLRRRDADARARRCCREIGPGAGVWLEADRPEAEWLTASSSPLSASIDRIAGPSSFNFRLAHPSVDG
jgi:hypothetical protein